MVARSPRWTRCSKTLRKRVFCRVPRRPPTSHEVARLAGVSRSTVSIVLNGVTTVAIADSTRAKVLDAARQLGYVPSSAARHLASGRAHTLGLVVAYAEKIKVDAF